MYYSTITSKGQTTIPANIREKLSLSAGDKVEFISNGNSITIIPINKSVKDLKSILPKTKVSLTCEEMDNAIKNNL